VIMSMENRSVQKCNRCGKPLTNEISLDRGYGPVCWSKQTHGESEHEDQDKQYTLNDFMQEVDQP